MNDLFNIIFALLSIIGLVTIVKWIILKILKNSESEAIIVIPLQGHHENIEYHIRCAVEQSRWYSNNSCIICLDKGMDSETKEICKKVCERFGIKIINSASYNSKP